VADYTDKYGFEEVSIGTEGWAAKFDANLALADRHLHTYLTGLRGEQELSYGAVVCFNGSTSANYNEIVPASATYDALFPAIGCCVIPGEAQGDPVLVQRIGFFTNPQWNWSAPGTLLYLAPYLPNDGLTETKPGSPHYVQPVAVAWSVDTIFLMPSLLMT